MQQEERHRRHVRHAGRAEKVHEASVAGIRHASFDEIDDRVAAVRPRLLPEGEKT